MNQIIQDNRVYFGKGDTVPRLKKFVNEERAKSATSMLLEHGSARSGMAEVDELFNKKTFEYPKPTDLIIFLLKLLQSKDCVVMDFFSGSATTAHAVMQLNAQDGGNRKFIMVQMPEQTKDDSDGAKAGYKTIDEIGRDRIKKVAAKIKGEFEELNQNIDLGFKHFTVKDISQNQLHLLEEFDPNKTLVDENILSTFGVETVLTTWMNADVHGKSTKDNGGGLLAQWHEVDLDGYTAYNSGSGYLYLLQPNLVDEAIVSLVEKLESDKKFNVQNIVLFGYSFTWLEVETLKSNLKRLEKINIKIKVEQRY